MRPDASLPGDPPLFRPHHGMHGTSRHYKPPPDTPSRRSARESALESARETARDYEEMKYAGLSSVREDNKNQNQRVKKMSVMGDSSLKSFGSESWAPKATQSEPRLMSSNQATFGIVGVPDWQRDIGNSHIEAKQNTATIWLGTRYARAQPPPRPQPTEPPPPKPIDPRLLKWHGVPPPRRDPPSHRPPFAGKLNAAAERAEVNELRQMGIGQWVQSDEQAAPRAPKASAPAADAFARAVTTIQRDKKPAEDLSWVTGPWAVAANFVRSRPRSAPSNEVGPSPVPELALDELLGTSKTRVAARARAPVWASG